MSDEKQAELKERSKIFKRIEFSEESYRKQVAAEDARNLAYWRGNFWDGDGTSAFPELSGYNAQQNEVFPILDSMASALAMDLPQVEALDHREMSYKVPSRGQDDTFSGRRIAAILNWMAEQDDYDESTREATLHAMLFGKGAIRKITWSKEVGRVIWRLKMPWEVFFDPTARRLKDCSWISERFILHESEVRARVENEYYEPSANKHVRADTYPRELIDEHMGYDESRERRREGLKEYVTMHEYWDFRRGKLYHIHMGTKQIMMEAEVPYGNPYDQLAFHSGIGRIRGIPDTSLIAPLQQDINELVSARREMVRRLPRRMFYDKAMFPNEDDAMRWMNSATWDPVPIETDGQALVGDMIYVTPEMPTTFDFNRHLEAAEYGIKNIAGLGDFQRGEVRNIRTAAEANMIQASVQGRMNVRLRLLTKFVKRGFDSAAEVLRWAVENSGASEIDLQYIVSATQVDADASLLAQDIQSMHHFRVLPFSPLMEDKHVRREQLVALLGQLASAPTVEEINWREITRELIDLFDVRPSIVKEKVEEEPEMAAELPPELPPDMAGLPGIAQFPGG